MIEISKLPLIKTPDEFFSADKILFIEVCDMTELPSLYKNALLLIQRGFDYKDRFYVPYYLTGSSHNLFLRVKNGIHFELLPGVQSIVGFDGNLVAALNQNKIYDVTKVYDAKMSFANEEKLLIERYIIPYKKKEHVQN